MCGPADADYYSTPFQSYLRQGALLKYLLILTHLIRNFHKIGSDFAKIMENFEKYLPFYGFKKWSGIIII